MAIIKKPTPSEMALARLRAIYLKAEQDIIREITRKRDLGLVDYGEVASLQRVQGILQNMNTKAEEYVPKMVETYFYTAEQQVSAPAGYANALTLTSTQTDIAETLVGNLLADITEASQTAYATAEEYLRIGRQEAGLIRQTTLELVTQGEASGKGWRTVQNQMAAELNAKGVTAFVDKAGRKWSLESYCSMATRTTGRQAEVAAALTSDDWDLWQISKIGSTCPLCSVYEGRVYSKSGTDPDYPPLSMAFGKIDPAGSNDLSNTWLNIHPNCLHSLVRYTTAGKSDKQIQAEIDFSSFEKRPADVDYRTKKQIEAYRKKEADRARYRADVKQFEKYKVAGVEGMPVRFETFEKHKLAGDDVYKGWESKFRSVNSQAKRIENAVESDIMKTQAGGLSRKDDLFNLEEPMPQEQFDKIKKAFRRQGGDFIMDEDAQAMLEAQGSSGITLDGYTILFSKNPSRATVFEELIHATQFRNGEIKDSIYDGLVCEIKAKEKLIKYKDSYKLTDIEIETTRKQLEEYRKQLVDLQKRRGGWL